jgi:hypothetical protein
MSKQHPQSGPSLSKPTYKPKSRREQEAEDAEAKLQEVEKAEKETKEGAHKEAFGERAEQWGGRIPFRGSDSKEFWGGLREKRKEKEKEKEGEKQKQKEQRAKVFAEWKNIK